MTGAIMVASVHTGTLQGIDAVHVSVEADLVRRLPRVSVVGLAADAVRESTERVRSAIVSSGLEFPKLRVTINLAPADLRKTGTGLDLPIALAILTASGQVPEQALGAALCIGELSLDGRLRGVPGGLPLALLARRLELDEVILPRVSATEAALLPGLRVLSACSLADVVAHLRGERSLPAAEPSAARSPLASTDLSEVRGQIMAKRALEIAAAGGHSLLMLGPPGVGKTMLATRLPGILPELTREEAIESTCIHSVAGLLAAEPGLLRQRPFRAPHHSVSAAGLLGNARLRPGEITLAHNGVLFLDELPEFSRNVLEQLRAPLESREVVLTRAAGTARMPASVSLIAAANPCPCGFSGHPTRACVCTEAQQARYAAKLSGPLADRFDMMVHVEPLAAEVLTGAPTGETSAVVRERVAAARRAQQRRYSALSCWCNAEAAGPRLRRLACVEDAAVRALSMATDSLGLSGRGHDKVLGVARTIADLEGADAVAPNHVIEALAYRIQDQSEVVPSCGR